MTQLEFHDKFQTDEQMFIWVNEVEEKIAKLESENAKLQEGKHCHGCKYACVDGTHSSFYKACQECVRSGWHDCYEPKAP